MQIFLLPTISISMGPQIPYWSGYGDQMSLIAGDSPVLGDLSPARAIHGNVPQSEKDTAAVILAARRLMQYHL